MRKQFENDESFLKKVDSMMDDFTEVRNFSVNYLTNLKNTLKKDKNQQSAIGVIKEDL
jgi:hypothetical protein